MAQTSIFTQVRCGEVPGEVVYSDDEVFVIMTNRPNNPGHCLVIPVEEIPDFMSCPPKLVARLIEVAHHLMKLEQTIYQAPRVALVVAGLEVNHTHLHVFPISQTEDLDPGKARSAPPEAMKTEADKLRAALKDDPIR